ncbi:hypothetical protein Tco_0573358 [Tanacetum coccineum]
MGVETIVYVDSDHGGDYVDRKSTSGVCTFMGCCLTSWFSKKQTALAISTTEAEYVSAGKACQQALWMKQALVDYDIKLNDIPILCDNKGTINLSKNPPHLLHPWTLHRQHLWHHQASLQPNYSKLPRQYHQLTTPPPAPTQVSKQSSPLRINLELVKLIFSTPPTSPHHLFDSLDDLPPRTTNPPPPQPTFESIERIANQPPPFPDIMDMEPPPPPIPPHIPPLSQPLWSNYILPPLPHETFCEINKDEDEDVDKLKTKDDVERI